MIGTMSGTSADGVDVALVEISGDWPRPRARLIADHARAYPADLRRRIFAVRERGAAELGELASLARDISLEYARAVNAAIADAGWKIDEISAVAAHGQTLYHSPPATIQWLDPALLAHETGCRVVSDFRRADCAVAGQGAPLVPFADWVIFAEAGRDRVLLNLGGIANITVLPAGATLERVIAFDTGPANCVSDWLCRRFDPDGGGYDADGRRALRGRVLPAVAERFLAADYFHRPPPKSTDGPEMIGLFQEAARYAGVKIEKAMGDDELNDLLATAALVAAATIINQMLYGGASAQWIVSGGGLRNAALMENLRRLLGPTAELKTSDDYGFPSPAKEAVAFALLAAATLAGVASNVPAATGAARAAILGSITPAPPR